MDKEKKLAEIICKNASEEKLTIKNILSAFRIVLDKYVSDATI